MRILQSRAQEAAMTVHFSERFHDDERAEAYLDLVQSSLDRPVGMEQAHILDRIASLQPALVRRKWRLPRVSLRWFAMPRLPLPFLTWA
jgi:hypothetical protein